MISRRSGRARSEHSTRWPEGALLLGRFQVRASLGEDDLGRCYEAVDEHGATVHVRLCSASPPGAAALLARTARLSRLVMHPNLCSVRACAREGNRVVLVTDVVPGPTLAERLEQKGAMTLADVRSLARDLSSALAVAHARGIVHGSLHPGSIRLLGQSAVVCDLGVAQAASGCKMDERADVHGLGRVLYGALTGGPPFERPAEMLPPEVRAPILRCLQRDPNRRFGSMVEAAAALGCSPLPSPARSLRKWAFLAFALVGTALAGLWAYLPHTKRARPAVALASPQASSVPVLVAAKKPVVAVVVSSGESGFLARALRELLVAWVRESRSMDVLSMAGDETTLIPAAWKSQVDVVLSASVQPERQGLSLELKVLDVATGALRFAERASLDGPDELSTRTDELLALWGRSLGSPVPRVSDLLTSSPAALRHYALGLLAMQRGDREGAKAELYEAARVDRQFFAPRAALVPLLRHGGRKAEADQVLAEALPLAARAGEWGVLTARHLGAGSTEDRLSAAARLSERFPHDAAQALDLAGAKRAAGDFPGCVAEARRALALDASFASAHREIALCTVESGDMDAAVSAARAYAEAMLAGGQLASGQELVGDVLFRRGRYRDADEAYRRALESSAGSPSAMAKRGLVLLYGRGKCLGAVMMARKAARAAEMARVEPDGAEVIARVWVVAALACGDGAQARDAESWLRRLFPTSAVVGELARMIRAWLGEKDGFSLAKEGASDEGSWSGSDRAWRFGPAFVAARKDEKSAEALELLGPPTPSDRYAFLGDPLLYHVALARIDVGDPDEAELLCREVLSAAPAFAPGRYCLARVAEAKKEWSSAFREYRAFLDQFSDGDDNHRLLFDARRRIKTVVGKARAASGTP